MSVSTALRAAKILGFWNLKRFVIDKNGGTLYLHYIIFLMPTLPNYLGVSNNGINLTVLQKSTKSTSKIDFCAFQWSGIYSKFHKSEKTGDISWCNNWFPRGGGDSAYERGGDACQKFWIKPLKETDLGVAQAFFDP